MGIMEDKRFKVIDSHRVKSFIVDDQYSSRMLFDDTLAGKKTIQINEGTVAPGAALPGATHAEDEIYYILSGDGHLNLDQEIFEIRSGHLVYIPAGTFHALSNEKSALPLVLLTLWRDPADNEVYNKRIQEWGASFKLADES